MSLVSTLPGNVTRYLGLEGAEKSHTLGKTLNRTGRVLQHLHDGSMSGLECPGKHGVQPRAGTARQKDVWHQLAAEFHQTMAPEPQRSLSPKAHVSYSRAFSVMVLPANAPLDFPASD